MNDRRRGTLIGLAIGDALHDAETFDEAVLKAVNLGDDADTTGAVCGQLAGAFWGERLASKFLLLLLFVRHFRWLIPLAAQYGLRRIFSVVGVGDGEIA